MAIRKILAAQSPITLTQNDFSEILNVPYCLLIASGGGNITVNLPTINSLNKNGKLIVICEDAITDVQVNCNAQDSISENGNVSSLISVSGNKNFIELEGITYINGNIWLGSSNGGSGSGITSVTYSELTNLITNQSLISGHFYLITDFQMVTYIQFSGGGIGSEDINTGAVEPMIVQANANNELSSNILSTVFPNDKITWNWSFADREWDAVEGQSTGIITSRYDTILKLYRDYDWRNIIFRRWETVNGSGTFDSITDTGFNFQDYSPFELTSENLEVSIGSPLSQYSNLGLQYWLDNFVCKGNATFNSIKIGYGVTTELNFSNNYIGLFELQYCPQQVENNSVSNVILNTCTAFIDNIGVTITNNTIGGEISFNNVDSITDNQIDLDLSTNNGINIENNVSAIASSSIYKNNCDQITNNTGFDEISGNVGKEIRENQNCTIVDNNVNTIYLNNGVAGVVSISGNTGYSLENNSSLVSGFSIQYNNVNLIGGNQFYDMVSFSFNSGNIFSSNSFETAGSGNFDGNVFGKLELNFFDDSVQNNLFMANIANVNISTTTGMQSINPSVTIWDSVSGNVEQKLSGGVIAYTPI